MPKFVAHFGLALLLIAAASRGHADELAGEWTTEPTGDTHGTEWFVFEHHETSWSGFVTGPLGQSPLENIHVDGKKVSFDTSLGLGSGSSQPQALTIHGTLDQDRLHLVIPSLLGNGHGQDKERIAHRVSMTKAKVSGVHSVGLSLSSLDYNGLAATPPMGWNSWNKFRAQTDDALIREIAAALVKSGLKDAGYVYVNIDDGWEGKRDPQGVLHPNDLYPDMRDLAKYVHSLGLKLGIYSSPGPKTCGGFEGSYGHEEQDAKMFAEWGIDYLKYDWCSADQVYYTPSEMQAAYLKMGAALRVTGRSIVYALCQYGVIGVEQWGRTVGGNLWRTTFDIGDNWDTMSRIGFQQVNNRTNAGPGGWNDADMLEVGNGGMSLEEYRTHFTLWSMASAPLVLGNDVRNMSAEIKALLANRDVIAVDQDPLGKPASRVAQTGTTEIWSKRLLDGDAAVAFFNRSDVPATVETRWSDVGVKNVDAVRDLWNAKEVQGSQVREQIRVVLPAHGTALFRVRTAGSFNVVFIGDSITHGTDQSTAPVQARQYLEKEPIFGRVNISNQGYGGQTTVNFLPSQGDKFPAVERAASDLTQSPQDTLVFSIMLGTNDSAMEGPTGSPVSPNNYRKNLESMIDHLLVDYPDAKVVVHRPIWYSPNTYNYSRYLSEGLQRLESYFGQIDAMVESYGKSHPGRVFAGDRDAFDFFKKNFLDYLKPEKGQQGTFYLHPNAEGDDILGRFWATAIYRSLQEPQHQQVSNQSTRDRVTLAAP